MKASASKTVIVDTGFWIALLEPRDAYHNAARARADQIDLFRLAIPWPSLYETIDTRLARRPAALAGFLKTLAKPNAVRIDDCKYREKALELTLANATAKARSLSLVDSMIRLMLADPNLKVHAIWTYNYADFHDVCRDCRIEMPIS